MTLDATLSLDDVGNLVGKSGDWVARRVQAFEHLNVGRTVRFTVEQADTFIRSFIVRPGTDADEDDTTDPLRDISSQSMSRSRK